jgi:hypothetical protein
MWYGISLSVGIILLVISLFKLTESISFLKKGEKANAVVFELEKISGSDGPVYKPIFRFKDYSGQEYIYRHNLSASTPTWKIGDRARVIYDPLNPGEARLLTYFGSFSATIILLALALPLITIGAGYYLAMAFFRQF